MNPHLRAVLRFWWVLVLGLAAAALTGTLMLYNVKFKSATEVPKLTERAKVRYESSLGLLVDSPVKPWLQTQTREVIDRNALSATRNNAPGKQGNGNGNGNGNGSKGSKSAPATPAPKTPSATPPVPTRLITDRASIQRAAKFYPILINSDQIVQMREKLIGRVPGVVRAKNIDSGRRKRGSAPVILIAASAPRPGNALRLVNGTAEVFTKYLAAEQWKQKVPPRQKIILRQLNAASAPTAVGGPTYGLPLLASIAVFLGFGALALVLDRVLPGRRREDEAAAGELADPPVSTQPAYHPAALGDAVAQIARDVGALRTETTRPTQ